MATLGTVSANVATNMGIIASSLVMITIHPPPESLSFAQFWIASYMFTTPLSRKNGVTQTNNQ